MPNEARNRAVQSGILRISHDSLRAGGHCDRTTAASATPTRRMLAKCDSRCRPRSAMRSTLCQSGFAEKSADFDSLAPQRMNGDDFKIAAAVRAIEMLQVRCYAHAVDTLEREHVDQHHTSPQVTARNPAVEPRVPGQNRSQTGRRRREPRSMRYLQSKQRTHEKDSAFHRLGAF